MINNMKSSLKPYPSKKALFQHKQRIIIDSIYHSKAYHDFTTSIHHNHATNLTLSPSHHHLNDFLTTRPNNATLHLDIMHVVPCFKH